MKVLAAIAATVVFVIIGLLTNDRMFNTKVLLPISVVAILFVLSKCKGVRALSRLELLLFFFIGIPLIVLSLYLVPHAAIVVAGGVVIGVVVGTVVAHKKKKEGG